MRGRPVQKENEIKKKKKRMGFIFMHPVQYSL